MTEYREDCRISLYKFPWRIITSANFSLKIPNFFTLPEFGDTSFHLKSPSFEFSNATWCFRFENAVSDREETENCFNVSLVRLNSEIPNHNILCGIFLLDANDDQYDQISDAYTFKEHRDETFIHCFDNKDPSNDRRDTLTLKIYLVSTEPLKVDPGQEEAFVMDNSQEPVASERGLISLSDDLKCMLRNGQDHNLTFNVKGKNFLAHQDILRARSEVFCSMLSHDMQEKKSGVIEVPDCDPQAFEQLLCYVYTGKTETLDENNMFGLYYAADKYNLAHLKEKCGELIKKSLSLTNVCEAIALASKHSDEELLNCAINYFTNNADDIFPTVEWQLFLKENSTIANELIIKSFKKLKVT